MPNLFTPTPIIPTSLLSVNRAGLDNGVTIIGQGATMRILSNLFLTFIISTTLVFAYETTPYQFDDANSVEMDKLLDKIHSEDINVRKFKEKIIREIDKKIARHSKSNKTFEQEKKELLNDFNKSFNLQHKVAKGILKSSKHVDKYFKKVKESRPELTKTDLIKQLSQLTSLAHRKNSEKTLINAFTQAGSLQNYYLQIKHEIEQGELSTLSKSNNQSNFRSIAQARDAHACNVALGISIGLSLVSIIFLVTVFPVGLALLITSVMGIATSPMWCNV